MSYFDREFDTPDIADPHFQPPVTASSSGGPVAWSGPGLQIRQNTLVSNGGTTYVCATGHVTGATFDSTKFESVGSGVSASSPDSSVAIGGTAVAPTFEVAYGTAAHTAAQGNDSRIANALGGGTSGPPTWAATTAYTPNQVVGYHGALYVCINAHTSGSSFPGAGTNWRALGGAGSTVIFANDPTLPGGGMSTATTTIAAGSNNVNVNTLTGSQSLNVASTAAFASSGTLMVPTSGGWAAISYVGTTSTAFTGCTFFAGQAGTVSAGGLVAVDNSAAVNGINSLLGTAYNTIIPGASVRQAPGMYYFAGPIVAGPARWSAGSPGGSQGVSGATWEFPIQTGNPTAYGLTTAAPSAGQTSLALQYCDATGVQATGNSFPAASASNPQWAVLWNYCAFQYTGITGTGNSITLTGITDGHGNPGLPVGAGGVQVVVAGPAVMSWSGLGGNWSGALLDNTITVIGPAGLTRNNCTPETTITSAVALSAASIPIASTAGGFGGAWPLAGLAWVPSLGGGMGTVIAYTDISGGSLTGCSVVSGGGGTAVANTTTIFCITPPMAMDGVFCCSGGSMGCNTSNFRFGNVYAGDHEKFERSQQNNNYAHYAYIASRFNPSAWDQGNQIWDAGIVASNAMWTTHYVMPGCQIQGARIGVCHYFSQPWAFWHEPAQSSLGYVSSGMLVSVVIDTPSFEQMGLGIVGSCDANGYINSGTFIEGSASWGTAGNSPTGFSTAFGSFAADMLGNVRFIGSAMIRSIGSAAPWFTGDNVLAHIEDNLLGSNQGSPPVTWSSVTCWAPRTTVSSRAVYVTFPGGLIATLGGAVTAGDILNLGNSVNNVRGFSQYFPGNSPPAGVALQTISSSVDVGAVQTSERTGQPFIVNNKSGATITAFSVIYADNANRGGVTATAPGANWIAPIGMSGPSSITTGTSGKCDLLPMIAA